MPAIRNFFTSGRGLDDSRLWRYGTAIMSVVATLVLSLALDSVLRSPYVTFAFLGAVILAARLAGRGPALLASALSVLSVWYFFLEPRFSLAIANPSDVGILVALAVVTAAISLSDLRSLRGEAVVFRRTVLLGGALLTALVLTRLLYADFARARDRQHWVEHTYRVLDATQTVASNLEEAEDGQRSYLLTGEETYLQPYERASREEQPARQALRTLTADNPVQQSRLDTLDPLVKERFAIMRETIALRRDGNPEAALALVKAHKGTRMMDECRAVLHAIRTEEQRLLAERVQAAEAESMRMRWVLGLGSGALMLLLLFASLVIERDSRNREHATRALKESEERLHLALDAANAGAWEWDVQTGERVWSEELWEVFGIAPHSCQPSYQAWLQIVHPDDRARVERLAAESGREGTELNMEYRVLNRDGSERWLLGRAQPQRDREQRVTRFVGIALDITQRKQAEEAMRERERVRSRFTEAAPVAIAMFDTEMKYLAASRRFREDYNLGAQELVGRSHYEIFPELPQHWREIHQRCLQGAVERSPGEPFARPDGTEQWVRWEVQPWRRADGVIGGIVLYSEDITAQKEAEQALRESEEHYRTLFESMHEGFVVGEIICDGGGEPVDWRYLETNPAASRMFSRNSDEMVGRTYRETFPNPSWQDWVGCLGRVALSGEPAHFECYGEGTHRQYECFAYSPKPGQFAAVLNDVSERKKAEEALRESEEQFRTLANSIPQLCWMANADGRIFWYNWRWYEYTGTTPEQMEGWGWQSVHDPEILPAVLERWKGSIASGAPFDMVFPLRAADGLFRPFLTRVMPVRDREGKIVRWFGTNTDISELRRIEQALREGEERLRLAQQAANLGTWDWDIAGDSLVWSPRCLALFGLAPGTAMTYDRFLDAVHVADRDRIDKAVRTALERHEEYDVEMRTIWPDGSLHWVSSRGTAYYDHSGRATRMSGAVMEITSRKQAEEELRLSESRFRALVTASSDVVYRMSPDWNEMFQLTGQNFIADTDAPSRGWLQKYIHPDDRSRLIAAIDQAIRTASVFELEHRVLRVDGSLGWTFSRAVPLRNESGEIVEWFGAASDISRRKAAEEALRESEDRFRTLIEQASDAFFLHDDDGRFLEVNRQACESLGYTREELLRMHVLDVEQETDVSTAKQYWEQAEPGKAYTLQGRQRRKDGTVFPVEIRLSAAYIGGRKLHLGLVRDVTERMLAEAALRQSERRYSALFANKINAIAHCRTVTDANGRPIDYEILEINTAYELTTGIKKADIEGKLARQVFPGIENASFDYIGNYGKIALEGGELAFEVFFEPLEQWLSVYVYSPNPGEFVAIFTDVTARKLAEQQIRQLNAALETRVRERTAQLESANKELEAFSYSVSHDLRAPLRGIDGWSLALIEDYGGKLEPRAQQYLQRVRSETQRMGQLIDDMLELSRINRADMQTAVVDLSALANTVARRLCENEPHRQIEFVVHPALKAIGDARLLDIVLVNLFSNAFKFTGRRPDARVEFGQSGSNGEMSFYVKDNGVGFDMAYAQTLFGAFQRLHAASEFPGTGIGLATVQRVIHRHGGRVWAEAEPERGATFYFTLPNAPNGNAAAVVGQDGRVEAQPVQ